MIRRLGVVPGKDVRIADAGFPSPFSGGLEFSAPARGTWNIAHTGMLIPEAHEIFVCAQGCLRGVVLTAAEIGASERFSTVVVRENNVTDGDLEESLIEGVTDILGKLPVKPPAVLVYTSCIHHFMGADLSHIYRTLRARFPDIDFTDCYMNPIMRKSGLTPDQLMRRQLYSLLHGAPKREKTLLIAGNDFQTDDDGDFPTHLRKYGWELCEIQRTRSYAEYQTLAGVHHQLVFSQTIDLLHIDDEALVRMRESEVEHRFQIIEFPVKAIVISVYRVECDRTGMLFHVKYVFESDGVTCLLDLEENCLK